VANGPVSQSFRMAVSFPSPDTFLTSMISQLGQLNPTISSAENVSTPGLLGGLGHDDLAVVKQVLTGLHFIFPHEILPALDILDRMLVTRFVVISAKEDDDKKSTTPSMELTKSARFDDLPTATRRVVGEVFYVQSASAVTSAEEAGKSRYRRSYDPSNTYYEVRLDSWNCSCPAFAFSAFGSGFDREGFAEAFHHPTSLDDEATYTSHDEASAPEEEWRFGGTLTTDEMGVPVCKHILAAALGKVAPALFGRGVQRKEVGLEELAGWGAGWGD